MHKKGRQKYDIWLGEIKCNVKCEMSPASIFDVAIRHLFLMGGYQGQNSVFLFCCAILLFCFVIPFNILSFCYWGLLCNYAILLSCCATFTILYSVTLFCFPILSPDFYDSNLLYDFDMTSRSSGKTGNRNRE